MSKLSPQLDAIRIKYELAASDFWELPQRKGTWIIKHSALEKVAVVAGVKFDNPQIIEADTKQGIAVLAVRAFMAHDGKVVDTWATGEAAPNNNKNAYPWAMAEKRAKDRVILKLTGIEAYSEEEAEDFKRNAPTDAQEASSEPVQDVSGPVSDTVAKKIFPTLQSDLRASTTTEQLDGAWGRWMPTVVNWSDKMQENADEILQEMRRYLAEHGGDARQAAREMLEGDLRAAVSMDDLKSRWEKMGDAMRKLGKDDNLALARVKEEMKAAIQKMGGSMPDFDSLTHEQRIAGTP